MIDKDGTIVCGHTRYKAAKRLNLETVPCIVAEAFYVWRACYTMESEPRYCDLTIDRLQNLTGKGTKKNAD